MGLATLHDTKFHLHILQVYYAFFLQFSRFCKLICVSKLHKCGYAPKNFVKCAQKSLQIFYT